MSKVAALRAMFQKSEEDDDRPSRPPPPRLEIDYKPRIKARENHSMNDAFTDLTFIMSSQFDLFKGLQKMLFTEPHSFINCEMNNCSNEAIWECSICNCFLCNTCETKHQKLQHFKSHRRGINWIQVSRNISEQYRRVILQGKHNDLYSFWSARFDSRTISDIRNMMNEKLDKKSIGLIFLASERIKDDNSRIYNIGMGKNPIRFNVTFFIRWDVLSKK